MLQTSVNVREEYLRALHQGQKEAKALEAAGRKPGPAVLDEVLPVAERASIIELPVQEIPAERIIGTGSEGRISLFSASFFPLANPDSEFASKWMALCAAHLSDTGIRDPIECYEYLGDFYVTEGNKRVSVLRYFGAVRIPARIRRVLPLHREDPRTAAYYEFIEFHRATRIYDVQFRKPGDYARLYAALGKNQGEAWTDEEKKRFLRCFHYFSEVFREINSKRKEAFSPEEALLLSLKVYPYEQLCAMGPEEMKMVLESFWGDVKAAASPEDIAVKTLPEDEKKKSVISMLLPVGQKHLTIAFLYQGDPETSDWARGHAEGAAYLAGAFADSVEVKNYYHADTPARAEALLEQAAEEGAGLVFTTSPPLLVPTLKAAVKHPKARYFNCSSGQALSSVRSYYCRIYEGKFITGLIAGAMAENDLIGYIGSYPILGVPAAINAFALGARMTNPRAKVLLEWSCLPGDYMEHFLKQGIRVISNRDIPLPDVKYMEQGRYGTFLIDPSGNLLPLASPCWMWGSLYENIVRAVLSGGEKKEPDAKVVNYWWGMDSGVIDVQLTDLVPPGVRALAETMMDQLRAGGLDPFSQKITAQDGTVVSDGSRALSSLEILQMDRLCDVVEGHIPAYEELLPMSRRLVRELGVYRDAILPETETQQ